MPRAIALPIRQEIVARHQAGETLIAIAAALDVKYRTVRGVWQCFRDRGAAGLAANYAACSKEGPRLPPAVYAAALALRREHPSWGAPLIRVVLAAQLPAPLPSVRTLQLWFRHAGLAPLRRRRPPVERARGREPHQVWQLDAKEHICLGNGQQVASFSVVDEASGAVLSTASFSPGQRQSGAAPGRAGVADGHLYGVGSAGAAAGG